MADELVTRMILTLRAVLLAIALALLAFGVVSVVLVTGGAFTVQPKLTPILLPVLGLLAAGMIVAYLVMRRVMLASLAHDQQVGSAPLAPERLRGRFTALTIVGGALAEAPGLFGVVVFLLTGRWIALVVPLLSLAALAWLVPSKDRFARLAGSSGVA